MMTALSACLYSDLLSKPFEHHGRGPDTYDCVGLACEIQRRIGRMLPAYLSDEAELHRQLATGGSLSDSRRLDCPEPGAIALIRMVGDEHHIGTMLDAYRILHTSRQTGGPVVERILAPIWTRRILGFYRMEASA